jgi:hypothetical protein
MLLLTSLVFFFFQHDAAASWATLDDAEYTTDYEINELSINKDGTYEYTRDEVITILKDQARGNIGSRYLNYNPKESRLIILKAETINPEGVTPVEHEYIEEKTLASNVTGFDNTNQILIAFPRIGINSKTHLKYKKISTVPMVDNFFSDKFSYGAYGHLQKSTTIIKSEIPLYLEVSDPNKMLEISKNIDNPTQITVKLLKPIFTYVVKETDPWINEKDKTWFVISSEKNYSEKFLPFVDKYEKILNSPLPDLYSKIASQAEAQGKTDVEKFNLVTSLLAQEVRYMGDWRSINGGYVPRPLTTVANTKFGDCKDFATGTTAILRKMGYNAHVALVERGLRPSPQPNLPLLAFNHAILQVDTNAKKYWIDPTNFQSFAQGIFEDISEREALVLDPKKLGLQNIATEGPEGSTQVLIKNIKFYRDGDLGIETVDKVGGRLAESITGSDVILSKDALRYILITGVAPEPDIKSYTIEPFDLSSRIVRDYEFKTHVIAKSSPTKTTSGDAYRLDSPNNFLNLYSMDPRTRVSDFNMGYPTKKIATTYLDSISLVGLVLPGCNVKSRWVDAQRRISRKGHKVQIEDEVDTKIRLISVRELKSEEFLKTQSKLKDCFQNTAIVYKPLGLK